MEAWSFLQKLYLLKMFDIFLEVNHIRAELIGNNKIIFGH